jgi:hypothetical protein
MTTTDTLIDVAVAQLDRLVTLANARDALLDLGTDPDPLALAGLVAAAADAGDRLALILPDVFSS